MTEHLLIGIAAIFVLGIGAQWLAWRFRLPSILLLLVFGFVAGPGTGLLSREMLSGEWLFPLVALAVGIILFEGGLSLRLDELKEVGKSVVNLITIGVAVTWAGAGLAAYYLAGFNLGLAVIIGALLTVTGPTVIIPLLRHVRPSGRVGTVAKWEGITIDPVGAVLAVLVLEAVVQLNEPEVAHSLSNALLHALEGLLLTAFIGLGVGIVGAGLLILFLRRRLVPDYLQNPITLMVVILVFALADVLQEESGLLATTLMGIAMANQHYVSVRRIVEFKEDLRVLLISLLFIVLSARLEPSDLGYIGVGSVLFLAVLMLIVRPAAVFASTFNTRLDRNEKLFLSWLAPRGIVAAAVASIFGFRLQEIYPAQADAIVPVVFLVIVGTVAVYGLTLSPVARWLGLAQPHPQGVLFIGAHAWARRLAEAIQRHGIQVLLVDTNALHVRRARAENLPAERANALSEQVLDDIDLGGIGRMLAVTPNDEVNSLVALRFHEILDSSDIFQLTVREQATNGQELPKHLRGQPLFGPEVSYTSLTARFDEGAELRTVDVTDGFDLAAFEKAEAAIPLFLVRNESQIFVFSVERNPTPMPGDVIIFLIGPARPKANIEEETEEAGG